MAIGIGTRLADEAELIERLLLHDGGRGDVLTEAEQLDGDGSGHAVVGGRRLEPLDLLHNDKDHSELVKVDQTVDQPRFVGVLNGEEPLEQHDHVGHCRRSASHCIHSK